MKKILCAILSALVISFSFASIPVNAQTNVTISDTFVFHGTTYSDADSFINAVIEYYGSLDALPIELLSYIGSLPIATANLNNIGWNEHYSNEIDKYQALQYIGGRVISRFNEYENEGKNNIATIMSNWFTDSTYYASNGMPLGSSLAKSFIGNFLGGFGYYVDDFAINSAKITQSSVIPYSYLALLTDAQLQNIINYSYCVCYNSSTFAYYILPKNDFIGILINPSTGAINPVKYDGTLQTSSYTTNSGYGIRANSTAWVYASGATFGIATLPNVSNLTYEQMVSQAVNWGYIAPIKVGTSWESASTVDLNYYSPLNWEDSSFGYVPSDVSSYDFSTLLLADSNYQDVVQGEREEWENYYEDIYGEDSINSFLDTVQNPIKALGSLVSAMPTELNFIFGAVILMFIIGLISKIVG